MTAPLRILHIEDDVVDQMALNAQVAAEELPYQVQVASSLAEARHLLKSCVFDVVIADFHLGDGTSFDLFDILDTKLVIFTTGAGDEEIAARAMRLGVRDYLIKDAERNYLKLLPFRVDSVLRQWRDEQALRESEARYRDLFESAGDLIQGIAPDGTILFVNRAWREVLGYREEELRGLKLVDFVHPSSLSDSLDKFHRVLRGESIASMETTYVTKDGREVILEGSASCQFANGRPVSARAIFHEVTAKKHAEAELKAALKDKEVLLQEIHHRVKNNLQIVSSLLNLQANDYDDPTLRKAFAESQQRIRSMALIHEMLYESENLAEIDFGKYLRALVPTLMLGYSARSGGITHDIQADDIALRPQTAVPLALIVNELVTNSLSHAFSDGRSGRIAIECRRRDRGEIALMVRDNGLGLPQGFSMQNTRSLGLRLVGMMVNQLSAKLEARDEGGASFELVFTPMDETSAHR